MCKKFRLILAMLVAVSLPASAGLVGMSGSRCFGCATDDGGGGGDSFAHGDSVTITGSGFGSTMPTFKFAGGAAGQLETTAVSSTPSNNGNPVDAPATQAGTFSWQRFSTGPADRVQVVNDGARGKSLGRTQSSSGTYTMASEYKFNSSIPEGGKAYVTYWIKASLVGSGGSAQYKLWRMMGQSNVSDTDTNLVGHFLAGSSNIHENPGNGTSGLLFYGDSSDGYFNPNGNWMRLELKFIPGTQGNRDGKVLVRAFRGTSVPGAMSFSNGGVDQRTASLSYPNAQRYTAFMWERWVGNGYTSVTWGEDDHFAQEGSFRRVELWNTNTPSTATIREIQEPTSWSSTSITIRLNKGGLSAGTYYLVVLDDSETDTVLASKQITISQLLLDAPHVFDPMDAANDSLIARVA